MPTHSKLQRLILNSDFEDMHDLVFYVVGKFARRYFIPTEELIGPANSIYVREYHRWQAGDKQASLSSWLYQKIWYGLMSFVRREIVFRSRFGYCTEITGVRHTSSRADLEGENVEDETPLEQALTTQPNNYRLELESELSEAAQGVVRMLLDARTDLALTFSWQTAKAPRVRRKHMLRALREHLDDLGWPREKVDNSFREIRAVFCGEDEEESEQPKGPGLSKKEIAKLRLLDLIYT